MIQVHYLIENFTKHDRQKHLDLLDECFERGGTSTNHKGVLAQYLNTDIPYGTKHLLCHACNNSKCSNPKHLYWGTPKENVEDSINAGTHFGKSGKLKNIKKAPMSEEVKNKISNTMKGRPSNNAKGVNGVSTGKRQKGYSYKRKYSQMWITNGEDNTRIPLIQKIPAGWSRGRTRNNGE